MVVYGLVDIDLKDRTGLGDFIETYLCQEHAQAALAQVLSDEPAGAQRVGVVAVELSEASPN